MKIFFIALFFSISILSDTLVLENKDDCCDKKPIEIDIISDKSVNGITMKGVLKATTVGNMLNTITGKAKLTIEKGSCKCIKKIILCI